ncbi:MAG TPA: TRAP transporter TatT component family protein, partial [Polyangiales bacterium]|nr:TRAP transporter TatT component family protein [Polyangiales bacterium]
RAYLMYSRARDLVLRAATRRDPELPEMLTKDPKTLEAYLKEHWRDKEDDVPVLFWLMMTWSSSVNNSPDTDSMIDMPMIRVLAAWIAELDAGYEDAGALVFMGGFECSMPAALGGDPKKGKQYFERAAELTQRKNHIVMLNYAVLCAVALQDRALYNQILHEIIEAPDQGNAYRLSNKVARRRASRALAKVEELFE